MPRGIPPPNQSLRTLGFSASYATGLYQMSIKPEELTRFEPSRLAVQQTLGGAWADCFDVGITAIKIAGHTGWHGGPPDTSFVNGEEGFRRLREAVFVGWHAERASLISAGQDPSGATLTFIDTLDGFTDVVAPKSFTLRRSKSRPLLMMYTIELLVLQPAAQAGGPLASALQQGVAAVPGLGQLAQVNSILSQGIVAFGGLI